MLVLASLIIVSLFVARFVVSVTTTIEPMLKPTVYAAGISDLIACSVLPALASLVAAPTWLSARRRVREGRR